MEGRKEGVKENLRACLEEPSPGGLRVGRSVGSFFLGNIFAFSTNFGGWPFDALGLVSRIASCEMVAGTLLNLVAQLGSWTPEFLIAGCKKPQGLGLCNWEGWLTHP